MLPLCERTNLVRIFAEKLLKKFKIPVADTAERLYSRELEKSARREWRAKIFSAGTGTNIPSITRRPIESLPQLLAQRREITVLEVGAGANHDRTSTKPVSVADPRDGKLYPLIVTEPWQLARQLAKGTASFTVDILDVHPGIIDWIEIAKTAPPQGPEIPADLYDRAISEKLHPVLGDVLDLSLHARLTKEYDLVVALGTLESLAGNGANPRAMAIAAFLLLASHLKPDGVFLTDSETVRNFAMQHCFSNLVWFTYETVGLPLDARFFI